MDVFEDIREVALRFLPFDYRLQIERHAEAACLLGIGMGDCPYSDMDILDSDDKTKLVSAERVWKDTWNDCAQEMDLRQQR